MAEVIERGAFHVEPAPSMTAQSEQPAMFTVPLVDEQEAGRIYHSSILSMALAGAAIAAIVLGWGAHAIASGAWAIAGFGQLAAAGRAPALFLGAGLGAALGGFLGGVVALYRLPPRRT